MVNQIIDLVSMIGQAARVGEAKGRWETERKYESLYQQTHRENLQLLKFLDHKAYVEACIRHLEDVDQREPGLFIKEN